MKVFNTWGKKEGTHLGREKNQAGLSTARVWWCEDPQLVQTQ